MLLKFAFEDFIADRKFNNLSEATITGYQYVVRPFIEYCIQNDAINVEDVTRAHFKDYLMYYQQKVSAKANSVNTVIPNFIKIHAYVYGEDKKNVSEVNLDSISLCADTFYGVQSTLNYLKLNDYDFISMLERLSDVIRDEQTDDNLLDEGITALFGENFECAVQYKTTFDSSRLDRIEQMALETANKARQIRLGMLERGLNEVKEDLFIDLLAEFGDEELVIRIAETILQW